MELSPRKDDNVWIVEHPQESLSGTYDTYAYRSSRRNEEWKEP